MIDSSYLLGLYGVTSTTTSSTTSLLSSATTKKQPTAPWSSTAVAPEPSALLRAALGGRKLINEGSAQLDVQGASSDYKKLFALYQGLESLTAMVNRATTKGVSASELSLLAKRFTTGLNEVSTYVGQSGLDGVRLTTGAVSATSKSSAGVQRDSAVSATGAIHEGSPDDPVDAFQGDVAFDVTIRNPTTNASQTISIDLADMGATPRSLTKVLEHINGVLEDAGVETRFGRQYLPAEARTMNVNGKTVNLPAGADRWGLLIRGVTTEVVGFAPAATSQAVYVVQEAGTAGGSQLLKFQTDEGTAEASTGPRLGETQWVAGRAGQTNLPEGVSAVRASAVGPDGSLWLVADLEAGPDSQPIKGQADVALMKYDSAGRLVMTRAIGAASTASGYAIAVDENGRVAVAGSVTGALNPGETVADATKADSFVTVFDAEGNEQWTQRRGAREADEATAVSFGAEGQVIVAGRAKSAMTGQASVGGWDGYIQTFSESQLHPLAPIVATVTGGAQFGTTADDSVQAMTVSGSNLYTAGVEDGRMVVRHFTLDASGAPTLAATRDLGLASGSVSGIAVEGGQVILTGTTRNDALSVGTINNAHAGGTDAFVASLNGDLTASAAERLTYVGGAGDDTAASVQVVGGKVWITGVADRPEDAEDTDPTQAYLARVDATTGAVEWRRDWQGDGAQAKPLTLAVSSNGASVLDRLGLPMGEIDQNQSKRLIDATSLRVGDRFTVSPADGGRGVTVTIEARDTLQSLARKIEQASRMKLKVTVSSAAAENPGQGDSPNAVLAGLQSLTITARDGVKGAVLTAGEPGRDALSALGISPGFVGSTSGDGDGTRTFGLNLPRDLNLSDAAAMKRAGESLQAAMKAVRDAYRALAPQTATNTASGGTVPAYLTNQLANYQAALARLTG